MLNRAISQKYKKCMKVNHMMLRLLFYGIPKPRKKIYEMGRNIGCFASFHCHPFFVNRLLVVVASCDLIYRPPKKKVTLS